LTSPKKSERSKIEKGVLTADCAITLTLVLYE